MEKTPTHTHLVDASLKNWFRELEGHDAADVRGLLEALGLVLILIAQKAPATSTTLVNNGFEQKVTLWKKALGELLGVKDGAS